MLYRRLILTLIAGFFLLLPIDVSAVEVTSRTETGINRTNNQPQWQDLGMRDVLSVTGGSTLTPSTTVRIVHDSPSGITSASHAAAARHYSVQRLSAYSHSRTVSGYISLIRSHRL